MLETIDSLGLDGVIATNTTLARPGVFTENKETGGLSGVPLARKSTQVIRYIARCTEGRLPIIGVGGVVDGVTAGEKMDAGASLVQVYSGMIYRGPSLPREMAVALAAK